LTLDFQSFIVTIGRIVHIETQSEKHYRSDASYIKFWDGQFLLKPLDTIGNCQRPVFPLAVSQHMHIITNLWKFDLDWSSELRDDYERKKYLCYTKLCAFRCLISGPQILNLRSRNQIRGKLLLSRKLPTSERAVSHNVLYYEPLPITHYQVRFYANNCFE
jgi:hypothetical protein